MENLETLIARYLKDCENIKSIKDILYKAYMDLK